MDNTRTLTCHECGDEFYEEDMYDEELCHHCAEVFDDEDSPIDGVGFAWEGSALRAETEDNPRNLPCPTCKRENMLTPIDERRGYQCDRCADAAEGWGP